MAQQGSAQESSVTYEELEVLELEFDRAEEELARNQIMLTRPLYAKRSALTSQIPNFWPLVFEQAPQDIDEHIQPSDSALLLSSLVSLDVSHIGLSPEDPGASEYRSVAIAFEFSPNEHFTDTRIEKKFHFRRALDGWVGLVSEPVDISWKKGKDLTGGLLGLARRAWEEEQRGGGETASREALRKKIADAGLGGQSFFTWFGYRGRDVGVEETRRAKARETMKIEGKQLEPLPEQDGSVGDEHELEIFPGGHDLAVCIAEDLWPQAIKYFLQAQDQDEASDEDFESDDDFEAETIRSNKD